MNVNETVLVTGANGWVGSALIGDLMQRGVQVCAAVRTDASGLPGVRCLAVGELNGATDWRAALEGVSVVVHCAAKVHVMSKITADVQAEFMTVNVGASMALAEQALEAGVRRFIFISTAKVVGESTLGVSPFGHQSQCQPKDAYAISKLKAEEKLKAIFEGSSCELVIVRPPLVYGAGAKANFLKLIKLVDSGFYLPFGRATNRRSMIYLSNLTDLIAHCVRHTGHIAGTYMVSDDNDLALRTMLEFIAQGLGRPLRLLPIPEIWFRLALTMIGKRAYYDRLFGELRVDIAHTKARLNWTPPYSTKQGVIATAKHFAHSNQ